MNCIYVELLRAYKIAFPSKDDDETNELLADVKKSCDLYTTIEKAILSSRYPKEIIELAKSVGMNIPIIHRYGIKTYNYFIENIIYYENVLFNYEAEKSFIKLDKKTLINTEDPHLYLSFFSDFEILQHFDVVYHTRKELINNVLLKYI